MALLLTDGGTTYAQIPDAASIRDLTQCTMLWWVYPTNLSPAGVRPLWAKGAAGGRTFAPYLLDSGGGFNWQVEVTRPTALVASATPANMARIAANKWCFVGCQFDTGGANSAQKLFHGDLSTAAAEPAAYATQTVGTGTVTSTSGNPGVIGNLSTSNSNGFPGRIAVVMMWNRLLTLGEIRDQQFNPHPTSGCTLFMHLGYNGTGSQPDWSGNGNAGTVTGASQVQHVPLRPPFGRAAGWVPYVVSGGTPTAYNRTVSLTQGQGVARVLGAGLIRSATQNQAASLAKTITLPRAASQAQAAALARSIGILRTVSQAQAITARKTLGLTRALTQAQAAALTKTSAFLRTVTATQAQVASAVAIKVLLLTVSATQAQALKLVKQITLPRAVSQAQALTLRKALGLTRSATQPQVVARTVAVRLVRAVSQATAATISAVVPLAGQGAYYLGGNRLVGVLRRGLAWRGR